MLPGGFPFPLAMQPGLNRRTAMTLCPVALMVGCKKCPILALCPLKRWIGNYQKPVPDKEDKPPTDQKKT